MNSDRPSRRRRSVQECALATGFMLLTHCGSDSEPVKFTGPGSSDVGAAGAATADTDAGVLPEPSIDCSALNPGSSPIRRLTRVEYDNTVFQLLGDNSGYARDFVPEEEALGFNNQAAALTVSPLLAEQYLQAAEKLAENNAAELLGGLTECDAEASQKDACVESFAGFFRDFGARAFRRPLSAKEQQDWVAFFERALELGEGAYDPQAALTLVLQSVLQAPEFLYRVEFGETAEAGDIVPLTAYDMASRLSYLFWNTMPDGPLFDAAASGELATKEGVEKHARRLLKAPRAREAVKNFHRQWLKLKDIDGVVSAGKNAEIYPDYDATIFPLLRQETEQFFDHAIFEENASIDSLFTAPYSMMNGRLAEYYGIKDGPTGTEFVKVALDSSRYSGFLSQAGLLSLYAKSDRSSPIHRGLYVRKSLLCQEPPPPPDIVPEPPDVDPTKTTREQFAMHESEPVCAGCHALIDPLGLGFEHFDGIGRYREAENGLAIDASGEIVGTRDADGPFDGVVELGQRLADSDQVRQCVTSQWFRFAYGRGEAAADSCSLSQLNEAFAESGYDIKELLIALTQTDAFRYRYRVKGEE